MTAGPWRSGNRVCLLENGEAFYPRLFEAIRAARDEVLVETFILADDDVGQQLRDALSTAAGQGARVGLLVDGYGSGELPPAFLQPLAAAGVDVRIFDPVPRLFGLRGGVFRRMHRKLAVIDGTRAFVGGINFAMDHLRCSGPMSKQDYAVEVAGPVVEDIRGFMRDAWQRPQVRRRWWRRGADEAGRSGGGGPVRTRFVVRDNHRHRTDIERQYRLGMRMARQQLIVANAYFFPSYRLLRDMARAARRGVEVRLILQGQPDVALAQWAARWLYDYLLRAGVRIFEYRERPLHGKVAVADGRWSTVGSSNLDPLSLSLNLEANLVIEDEAFGNELQASLGRLIAQHCREFKPQHVPRRTLPRAWIGNAVFHLLRHFPSWAGLLPGHRPRLAPLPETVAATAAETAET